MNKLFKYFSMLKDDHKINTKGTGLGLNITKRIVESMGGKITVESKVQKGTKFSMRVLIQIKNSDSGDQNKENGQTNSNEVS